MRCATLVATVLCLFARVATADELLVPSVEYPTIQAAVDAAMDGDEVVLRDGDHHPRDILMPGKAIVIRGESGDRDAVRLVGTGDPYELPSRAFRFDASSSSQIVIRDLTITDFASDSVGGAMTIYDGASPSIVNCVFSNNRATTVGKLVETSGGAITIGNSQATFVDCAFRDNAATPSMCDFGVGIGRGGAISSSGDVLFVNCDFEHNTTYGLCDGVGWGGAIWANSGSLTLQNCTFLDNIAEDGYGDSMFIEGASVTLSNCTSIARFRGRGTFGGFGDELVINNSIMRGHTNPVWLADASPQVRYSNVEGGYPGAGNIDVQIFFEPGTYHLLPGSPCIDAGNTDLLPADEFDLDGDGDTTEPLPLDAAGLARFVDDPATPDTGMGFPVVDMGAFEYQPPCRVDLDGDGVLTIFDFLAFFNAFDDADPVADFDGDGAFTVFDFLAFQNEFDAGCE